MQEPPIHSNSIALASYHLLVSLMLMLIDKGVLSLDDVKGLLGNIENTEGLEELEALNQLAIKRLTEIFK